VSARHVGLPLGQMRQDLTTAIFIYSWILEASLVVTGPDGSACSLWKSNTSTDCNVLPLTGRRNGLVVGQER
jgi:hypothetical protein